VTDEAPRVEASGPASVLVDPAGGAFVDAATTSVAVGSIAESVVDTAVVNVTHSMLSAATRSVSRNILVIEFVVDLREF